MSATTDENNLQVLDIGELSDTFECLPEGKSSMWKEDEKVDKMALKNNILAYSLRFKNGYRALIERVYDSENLHNIIIKRVLFGKDWLTELTCTNAVWNRYREPTSSVWIEIQTKEKIFFTIIIDSFCSNECSYFSMSDPDWSCKSNYGTTTLNPIVTEISI